MILDTVDKQQTVVPIFSYFRRAHKQSTYAQGMRKILQMQSSSQGLQRQLYSPDEAILKYI